jgi:hypothetical protein
VFFYHHLSYYVPYARRKIKLHITYVPYARRRTVLPGNCKDLCIQHGFLRGSKKNMKEWYVIWFAVVWNVWWSRNQMVFKDMSSQWNNVIDNIQNRAWHWLKALRPDFRASLFDWFQYLLLCI